VLRSTLAALLALAALGAPASAGVTPAPNLQEQKCINALNAGWLGVLKAQNKDTGACLKDVAAGKASLDECLGMDRKGKVAKADG